MNSGVTSRKEWWAREDSNFRPLPCQGRVYQSLTDAESETKDLANLPSGRNGTKQQQLGRNGTGLRYISICSGIEAATVAWKPLGWRAVAYSEIEKFPSKLLAHHYPETPNVGDFTAHDWTQYRGLIDVVVAGTPCQAFSVAGLGRSLQDPRGNLTLRFIHAVNAIRPRFVVWENVPGILGKDDNPFGCFLAGLVGASEAVVFERGWPNAGVVDGPERSAAWRILDAQYFGLAQRRARLFVVASARGSGVHPAEILFEWDSLRRDSPPGREAGQGDAGTLAARTRGGGGLGMDFDCDGGVVAHALNAKGGSGRIDAESETFVVADTVRSHPRPGSNSVGLCVPFDLAQVTSATNRSQHRSGVAPTLAVGSDLHVAHGLRAEGFDASEDGTGRGVPLVVHGTQDPCVSDKAFPLGRNQGQENAAVTTLAIRGRGESHDLEIRTDGTANALLSPSGGRGGTGVGAIQAGMAVRRLTPTECEKLQGFAPSYTRIPERLYKRRRITKNRPIENWEPAGDGWWLMAADGPRYKGLGNSFPVPVMRWIGERIGGAA